MSGYLWTKIVRGYEGMVALLGVWYTGVYSYMLIG